MAHRKAGFFCLPAALRLSTDATASLFETRLTGRKIIPVKWLYKTGTGSRESCEAILGGKRSLSEIENDALVGAATRRTAARPRCRTADQHLVIGAGPDGLFDIVDLAADQARRTAAADTRAAGVGRREPGRLCQIQQRALVRRPGRLEVGVCELSPLPARRSAYPLAPAWRRASAAWPDRRTRNECARRARRGRSGRRRAIA